MKKILVTGTNSYIGNSFINYMQQWLDEYQVDSMSLKDGIWRSMHFSEYDCILHVAGIAHIKETKENALLYYKVNRDLAIDVAQKAKKDGVNQFIYLSSMSVYGMDTGVITKATIPNPKSNYGKSKLQAEERLFQLVDDNFKMCVLRPPMVYGKKCKGNFQIIVKFIEKFPIFPKVDNQRSMIFIDNLSSFIKMIVDICSSGLFFPQNDDYINTSDMAFSISDALGKRVRLSVLCGNAVKLLEMFSAKARKAFGSLVYENTEDYGFSYVVVNTRDSFSKSV